MTRLGRRKREHCARENFEVGSLQALQKMFCEAATQCIVCDRIKHHLALNVRITINCVGHSCW